MKTRHLIAIIGTTGLLVSCGGAGDIDDGNGDTETDMAGMTGEAEESGENQTTEQSGDVPGGTSQDKFADALAMVADDGDLFTMPDTINFIDQERINELAEDHEPWRNIGSDPTWQILSFATATNDDPTGQTALHEASSGFLPLPDDLMRIDLPAADTILYVGNRFDGGFRLVNEGQDTGQIEEAARDHGWVGDGPLLEYEGDQSNIPEGLQLLIRGDSSVATAGPGIDVSVVDGVHETDESEGADGVGTDGTDGADGTTLADRESVTVLRECLGDPVRAAVRYQIRPDAVDWFATGVIDGEDGPYTVVCSLFRDPDVAERVGEFAVKTVNERTIPEAGARRPYLGTGDLGGKPYSDYFSSAEYSVQEVEDPTQITRTGLLRTVLPHVEDAPLGVIFSLEDYVIPGAT